MKIEVKFEFDSIEELMQKMPALASARTPTLTPSAPTASSMATPRPTHARAAQGVTEGGPVRTTAGLVSSGLSSEDEYLSAVRSALKVIGQDGIKEAMVKAGNVTAAGDPAPVKDPMPDEEMREKIVEAIKEITTLAKLKNSTPAVEPEAEAAPAPVAPKKITKEYYLAESARLHAIVGNSVTADVMREVGNVNDAGKPFAPNKAKEDLWGPILDKLGTLAAAKEAA